MLQNVTIEFISNASSAVIDPKVPPHPCLPAGRLALSLKGRGNYYVVLSPIVQGRGDSLISPPLRGEDEGEGEFCVLI